MFGFPKRGYRGVGVLITLDFVSLLNQDVVRILLKYRGVGRESKIMIISQHHYSKMYLFCMMIECNNYSGENAEIVPSLLGRKKRNVKPQRESLVKLHMHLL